MYSVWYRRYSYSTACLMVSGVSLQAAQTICEELMEAFGVDDAWCEVE